MTTTCRSIVRRVSHRKIDRQVVVIFQKVTVDLLFLDCSRCVAAGLYDPRLRNGPFELGQRLTVVSGRIRRTSPSVGIQRIDLRGRKPLWLEAVEDQGIILRQAIGEPRPGW